MPTTRGQKRQKKKKTRENALRLIGTAAAAGGGDAVGGNPMLAMALGAAYPKIRQEINAVGNTYSSQVSGSAAARKSAADVRTATARYNRTLNNALRTMKKFIFNRFGNTKVWVAPDGSLTTLVSNYPPFTSNGNFRGEWLQETLHKPANALNNRNKVDLINRLGSMVNDENHTNQVRNIIERNLQLLEAGGPVRNAGSGHPLNQRRLTLLQASRRPTPPSVVHSGQLGRKRTFGGQGGHFKTKKST